jgi:dolichyl-phosphate beta-glucosyltransferase
MASITLVVPCYNEARRLDDEALLSLLDGQLGIHLVLVDDGSTDETAERLRALAARRPDRVEALSLPSNGGKAEAVRAGLQHALRGAGPGGAPQLVGYVDADLATPPDEIKRLVGLAAQSDAQITMASRVALLGTDIHRKAVRHYLGRVFSTAASLLLAARVYDTQCGAKLFRPSPALTAALAEPFLSRWAFDVELLGRLLAGSASTAPVSAKQVVEVPLRRWEDVAGSKLRPAAMVRVARDMVLIGFDLAARRRAGRGAG